MGVGGYCHATAVLRPGKRPATHCTGGWVDPELAWAGENNFAIGIRSQDRPAYSESCDLIF
jgi:hypothetical protein